jgi:general stress protein 26
MEMDSINKQQAEENYKDLQGNDAAKKIKELAEKADTCFFCTKIITGQPLSVRPMSPQKIDEDGNFWFFSAEDSYKNADIQLDDKVHLLFQGSAHSDFLSVYGKATITRDAQLIKELWSPLLKTWFTEGVDDPRITIIKIETLEAYYWDNKHGDAVAFIKMAAGALLGKTLDDSIEGKLNL